MKGFLPSILFILLSLSQHKECHCEQACNCEDCLKSRLCLWCCSWCCCCCGCWCCWWYSWCCCGYIGCHIHLCYGCNSCYARCSGDWYAFADDIVFNHWVESQVVAICCPELHIAHEVY